MEIKSPPPPSEFITRRSPHEAKLGEKHLVLSHQVVIVGGSVFFFLKKDGKKGPKMQRMKGIVGDWGRLVQESSYLKCTVVVSG